MTSLSRKWILILTFVGWSSIPPFSYAGVASTSSDSLALNFVSRTYIHGVPYDEARKLGPGAVPTLKLLLGDIALKPYWRNIILTIGFIGGPESYGILRSFTWDRFKGELDDETFSALIEVPDAMGCIAAVRESPEALTYLEKGTSRETWARLPWAVKKYPPEYVAERLSNLSISGLSWTGSPQAERVLIKLSGKPRDERQRRALQVSLNRTREIARIGLADYVKTWKEKTTHRGGN